MAGSGQIFTFSDTGTTKRTIASLIQIIDPQDTPCVSYFGTNNQSKFRLENFPNHKVEWLEDTLRVRTATLNESTLGTTATDPTVATNHGLRFKVGDVWQFDDTEELILVTSVTAGSDTITSVVRNWAAAMGGSQGTATSGPADTETMTYMFNVREEGADSVAAPFVTPTTGFNQSQIFHWEIKVSGSEQNATTRYGIPDTYKYQLMKAMGGLGSGKGSKGRAGDLMIDLERTFFLGQRVARASGTPGAMGGAKYYISTNGQALGGVDLTQKVLEDEIQNCWTYGGKPDVIICNAYNKRLISSWYRDSVRTERSERTGGVVINAVETEFGNLDVMLNRWCPSDEVYILQRDLLGWVTLRDWFVETLAKDGDYRKDQIIGEFSFVLQNEKAHSLITGTATS